MLPSCSGDVIWSQSLHSSDQAMDPWHQVPDCTSTCPIVGRARLSIIDQKNHLESIMKLLRFDYTIAPWW